MKFFRKAKKKALTKKERKAMSRKKKPTSKKPASNTPKPKVQIKQKSIVVVKGNGIVPKNKANEKVQIKQESTDILDGDGKFFKDKASDFHPGYQVAHTKKNWSRLVLTHKKKKGQKYITLDKSPSSVDPRESYIRKYIKTDHIGTRGEELKKYKLSSQDKDKIDSYLKSHKNKVKNKKS